MIPSIRIPDEVIADHLRKMTEALNETTAKCGVGWLAEMLDRQPEPEDTEEEKRALREDMQGWTEKKK